MSSAYLMQTASDALRRERRGEPQGVVVKRERAASDASTGEIGSARDTVSQRSTGRTPEPEAIARLAYLPNSCHTEAGLVRPRTVRGTVHARLATTAFSSMLRRYGRIDSRPDRWDACDRHKPVFQTAGVFAPPAPGLKPVWKQRGPERLTHRLCPDRERCVEGRGAPDKGARIQDWRLLGALVRLRAAVRTLRSRDSHWPGRSPCTPCPVVGAPATAACAENARRPGGARSSDPLKGAGEPLNP